jgi:DNA-binding transcriptional ArsR family regulator
MPSGVQIDRVFHALGDPTRREMLSRLCRGPHSASALARPLGISLTAVGQHLRVLQGSRLVRTVKAGRTRTCHIEPAGFVVLEKWIRDQRAIWERRLDRLGEILQEADDERGRR